MQEPPDAVDPEEHDVVNDPVPAPPAGMAAHGRGLQVSASVLQLWASQVRTTDPAKPGTLHDSVQVSPDATDPPAQLEVYSAPLEMPAQGLGEHVKACVDQDDAEHPFVIDPE